MPAVVGRRWVALRRARGCRRRRAGLSRAALGDGVWGDLELAVESLVVRGRAEVLQADDPAGVADNGAPALPDRGLHADPGPRCGGQLLVLVVGTLELGKTVSQEVSAATN